MIGDIVSETDLPDLAQSFHVLESRAAEALSKIAGLFDTNVEDSKIRSIIEFLSMQHADGCWGSDDYPVLKAVFTAQGMQTLQCLGLVRSSQLTQIRDPYVLARNWLTKAQRPDGSWGEDAFDCCESIKALLAAGVSPIDQGISKAANHLRELVDHNWNITPSFWSGTGFIASAMEVFNLIEDAEYAHSTLSQLSKCFEHSEDRFSRGTVNQGDLVAAPLEWHTACALIGLKSFGPVLPEPDIFQKALKWLKSMQTTDGCWSPGHDEITSICTYEVIVALTTAEGPQSEEARRGTDWLLRQSSRKAALQPSYNPRFMAAAAVARTYQSELRILMDLVLLQDLQATLERCTEILHTGGASYERAVSEIHSLRAALESATNEAQLASMRGRKLEEQDESLRAELGRSYANELRLQEQLSGYALKLSNNQLAVLGIALTLLTFFAGLFVALALK